jgi:transketolase
MPQYSEESLAATALKIRQLIITMLSHAKSGHSGGALGMADVFTTLYFAVAKHDSHNPSWEDRDRILLSNGHINPVLYATLAEAGYFAKQELFTLRQLHSRLQGHPHLGSLPGVENTSGPLAQGLSQACGVAYSFKMDKKDNQVFCLMSDGELEEGQNWEAFMFAGKYKLAKLTAVIDRNDIQIDGTTADVMPLEPLRQKLESFNWHVIDVDGHDFKSLIHAFHAAAQTNFPTAVICHTIPGKGVDFMENKYEWHGKPPTPEQAEDALAQLNKGSHSNV